MTARDTVLIAEDQPIMAEALSTSLQRWFDVVGVVTDLALLESQIETTAPDVVLLDVSFGKKSSLELLPGLAERFSATRFVILTAHVDPVIADAAMRSGATGFVVKESAPDELKLAIDEALAGRVYLTPKVKSRGAGGDMPPVASSMLTLSDRQRAVVGLLREGHTNAVIAERLEISTKTVEYHVSFLTRRLGIRGRGQLIRWSEQFFPNDTRQ